MSERTRSGYFAATLVMTAPPNDRPAEIERTGDAHRVEQLAQLPDVEDPA